MWRILIIGCLALFTGLTLTAQTSEPITLEPFQSDTFNIKGLRPTTWREAAPGTYARGQGMLDITTLIVQGAPGFSGEQLGSLLATQLRLEALPEATATRTNDALTWSIYETEVQQMGLTIALRLALASDEQAAYVVLLQASADEIDALASTVFEPVVDAVMPLGADEIRLPAYVDTAQFTETDITFGGDDFPINGTLTMPVGDGPFSAVVIVAGSGPNERNGKIGGGSMYRDLAYGLATQGIASIRYDKRTYTYGAQLAAVTDFSIDDEVTDDALSALDVLANDERIDRTQRYVIGHSLGAMLAPRIGLEADNLAGVILMAGSPRPFDAIVASQLDYIREVNPAAAEGDALASLEQIVTVMEAIRNGETPEIDAGQLSYFTSLVAVDLIADAQALDIPVLILHGERDYQVLMSDFNALAEALPSATAISYPTLQHTFMAVGDLNALSVPDDYLESAFLDEAVITDIIQFIQNN